MDGAEERAVAGEGPESAARAGNVGEFRLLRRKVIEALRKNRNEIASALVDAAIKGQVTLLKFLVELVESYDEDEVAELNRATRSLGDEWGAEPEWGDGGCIHCGKMHDGDRGGT